MRIPTPPLISWAVLSFVTAHVAHAQCRDWTEMLAQSFLSNRANPTALKQFSQISAEEYRTQIAAHERQGVQEHISRAVAYSAALPNLKSRLRQFYQIGAELYDVQLNPEQVYVLPDLELNAFATGRHIFFYDGILLYYLDPIQFLVRAGMVPPNMTKEAYAQLTYKFNWRNDWESLYSVLAHEATHNLMAHIDELIVEGTRGQLQQFSSDARAYRKAVAEGRSSAGVGHYLGQSLLTFLSAPERSRQRVAQEEEADAVASEILRRAGLRAESGLVSLQRSLLLQGPSVTGWRSIMNSLFCSTHPDPQQRLGTLQSNVRCVQFGGKPCGKHVTYPVADRLQQLRSDFARIEQYHEETLVIAGGRSQAPEGAKQIVEVKPDPKDARVLIDGTPVPAQTVTLSMGRHALTASRDGYHATTLTFAVFPDVKSSLKPKLRKCQKGKLCQSEPPEELEQKP